MALLRRRPLIDLGAVVSLVGATAASESFAIGENGYSPWFPPAAITLWFLLLLGPSIIPALLVGKLLSDWPFYSQYTRAYLPLMILPALAIALRGTSMQAQLATLLTTIILTAGARIRCGLTSDLVQSSPSLRSELPKPLAH